MDALARLAALVSGLLFVSEADHPLIVVSFGAVTESRLPSVLVAAASREGAEVQCMSLPDAFTPRTKWSTLRGSPAKSFRSRYESAVRVLLGQPLPALGQMRADLAHGDADRLHGVAQLRLGAAELLAPIRYFRGLADVDLGAVLQVIRHLDSSELDSNVRHVANLTASALR